MSNKFKWSIPSDSTPLCFTSVTHNIRGSSAYSSMESWSVEELDINNFVINFRTTSSEAGNIVLFYSGDLRIATLTLDNNIEPFLFYTIKVDYPKITNNEFDKYINIILKSQQHPSYPVFAFNSHTHLDLWSTKNNRYIANVSDSVVNELGSISPGPTDLINASMLSVSSTEYITPSMKDIYDFR